MGLIFIAVFILALIIISLFYELLFGVNQKESEDKWKSIIGTRKISKSKKAVEFKINFQTLTALVSGLIISLVTSNYMYLIIIAIITIAFREYLKVYKKNKRKELFIRQFRDFLISLSGSLKSGNSFENSIEKSLVELTRLHRNDSSEIMVIEVKQMIQELNFGYDLKKVLSQFKNRNKIDEVNLFVNSVLIVERKGGNTNEVVLMVCNTIIDKIEIKQHIEKLTSAKRFEATLLSILPLFIGGVMYFTSPDYYDPMTKTIIGNGLLVLALVLIIINHFIAKKIVEIKI